MEVGILKLPKIKAFSLGNEELKSIVAVFSHADRSPKQKVKLVVKCFLPLFEEFANQKIKEKTVKRLKIFHSINSIIKKN